MVLGVLHDLVNNSEDVVKICLDIYIHYSFYKVMDEVISDAKYLFCDR